MEGSSDDSITLPDVHSDGGMEFDHKEADIYNRSITNIDKRVNMPA